MNYLFILIILQSCSLNGNSRYWKEHNEKKIQDQKKKLEIIDKSNDIISMTIDEYEIYINDYIKKSKYPDISQ